MSIQPRPERTYNLLWQRGSRIYGALSPVFLPQVYTRAAIDPEAAEDPYGQTTLVWGPVVSGIPCHLRESQLSGADPGGNPTTIFQLMLLVRADDPLKEGDRVTDIIDRRTGQVADPGPAYVEWVRSIQPWGPIVLHEALLSREVGSG